jgi:hypothetical protein
MRSSASYERLMDFCSLGKGFNWWHEWEVFRQAKRYALCLRDVLHLLFISLYNETMAKKIMERRGRIEELDRSFDIAFWQSQSPKARFDATWELIQHYWRVKGNDVRQLRLHRSVESFQRQQR